MKTLISKLGALGDVVRTTVLLSELEGEVHWLTSKAAKDILNSKKIKQVYIFENEYDKELLKQNEFDLILSLDEERAPLEFLKEIKTRKLIGHFLDGNDKVDYTSECDYWLDMSFISRRFSKDEADKIKSQNKKSVPQIWIEMLGRMWSGQEYNLGINPLSEEQVRGTIGLIDVTESKWPNKYWAGYPELKEKLQTDGYEVISLGMKLTIKEHIDDINGCELIVCGDTLGMHLALGLKKKLVTIFNCTPPNEIYDYGRMKKIISPLIDKYIFNRQNVPEAQSAVPIDEVYRGLKNLETIL
ncbi:MAG: glycosyltransferase family 9 protein [Nanoarchaeota archaeon]|nr:glycosyltransferase family 9 protein [Nanoarchaeota archaeon]